MFRSVAISSLALMLPSLSLHADIIGARAVGYPVNALGYQGEEVAFSGYVVDLYLVSDDPTDKNLNIFNININNNMGISTYYQSLASPGWMPGNMGQSFAPENVRFADSFVSNGGRDAMGEPATNEDGIVVQMGLNGTGLDPGFGGNFVAAPLEYGGWYNEYPPDYVGSPIDGLVFIGRFSANGIDSFQLSGVVSASWNNGIGTPGDQIFNTLIHFVERVFDCNDNGIPDQDDIANGAPDENDNGIPDECEIFYGDLDLNGHVGAGDLAIMLSVFGQKDPESGDLDGDLVVDGNDLGLLLLRWDSSL